uniref:Diphosphomevalonate decarboxylase-like N-terminal domain-containing protein n=1 Tax=Rhodosorus marinus TaxID=101924 RepID=A0A7S3A6L1_9RHOD|mmetsp:Transcript_45343/g.176142  ORF Transcript_45343/g.176142 Transcript_45343/m.176142 type:complete len:138 (+) Transcript_45343:673-1086(+)
MERKMVTCTAPVNIALIKYWGKLDEDLIIPLNSSLSITLHQESLRTTTTVAWYEHDSSIRMWLNGEELDVDSNLRIRYVLDELRSKGKPEFRNLGLRIASVNNFPTAAGLASSAAGLACLGTPILSLRIERGRNLPD